MAVREAAQAEAVERGESLAQHSNTRNCTRVTRSRHNVDSDKAHSDGAEAMAISSSQRERMAAQRRAAINRRRAVKEREEAAWLASELQAEEEVAASNAAELAAAGEAIRVATAAASTTATAKAAETHAAAQEVAEPARGRRRSGHT